MSTILESRPDRPPGLSWRVAAAALLVLGLGMLAGYLLFGRDGAYDAGEPEPNLDLGADVDLQAGAAAHDHAGEAVYTCSMHPQIRRDAPGDCPICGMELIPVEAAAPGMADDDPAVFTMTEAAVAMARVQTSPVVAVGGASGADSDEAGGGGADGATAVRLTGTLAVDEDEASVLASDVGGRVEDLAVTHEGQAVRRGQRIATLYAPELVAAQRELIAATRIEGANPGLAEALRTRLRSLRVPDELIAEVERTGEARERIPVYAAAGGTVLEKLVEVGDYVDVGQPLFRLNDLGRITAEFEAFERDLALVELGDRIAFTTPAAPGETFAGRVSFIDPLIDPATRTATVRAEVPNPRGRLKPGMLVTGELAGGGSRTAGSTSRGAEAADGDGSSPLLVPATAVLWTGERSVVYVERPDAPVPSYEFREVTTAGRAGDDYVVTEGLRAGERVVTRGAFSIDAAAQLNNQFSMMNRDVVIAGRESAGATYAVLPDYTEEAPQAFRAQLGGLVQAYLPLKDALVASDLSAARVALASFGESLKTVDMTLLAGDAHDYWMAQSRALAAHAEQVAAEDSLEGVREQFAYLSAALITTVKAFGLAGEGSVYVEHCPMALDDEGADWLSAEPVVRNPYFGDAMLSCGAVTDTLGV